MLASPKLKMLEDLITGATKEEIAWISGYLSGLASQNGVPQQSVAVAAKPAVNKITIAYGTETGNSKKLASDFAAKAKRNGINAKLVSLDQYRLTDLPKEEYFLAVISTQGEGEPPASAKKFYDHIHANGLKLDKLKFGVLALGDTSYPLFCKAGEDVDIQLNKLGGQRLVDLKKCDTDYEADAANWFSNVLETLSATQTTTPAVAAPVSVKKPTGKKIYTGALLSNINLNDRGSKKETRHIEIAADDVEYLPGDALGVIPENPIGVVEAVIGLTKADRNKLILFRNEEVTVHDLLRRKLNIGFLPERVVKKYAALVGADIPVKRMALMELLDLFPLKDTSQIELLIEILEPLAPRLYSISSSPDAQSGEVHLTVARDLFLVNEEIQCGICSDYLSHLKPGATIDFYIHKNNIFRLPQDDRDIIMIGPGTGIAPFRSFLAHRDAIGSSGRNWLFFGDQHFVTDFLYQTELQNWLQTGVLTKLDVAFSRDQKEKIYVQHKMLKYGEEFYNWLNNGASIYVCGAKEPMSIDVEDTILQIIENHGNKSIEEAVQFIEQLKEEGRYVKDVY
ncbi:flavodoxin domain-containing protein [Chitinophagaceae bacterium LB-8]|uniref:assimilatory sulfite reductase (NADPH) n=1 Tax=Paraflavisolibacter caeni TaxID=2982496 RepID=A0A9X2XPF9_9BACT|nr:flavodoxin domain-containing protein [Paraflavisolibacter caeni]MCU7550784.1 flavodoxin domain-containing protein [Paraflavisolibacter caeni]